MNLLKKSFIVLLCVCVVTAGGFFSRQMIRKIPVFKNDSKKIIVIDPGHGGSDPGKVGIDGSLEKDINLAISMYLKKELERKKYKVIMTREKDTGLYSQGDTNKKIADLNKRVEIMNGSDAALVVSIHQNSFTGESSKGAQVFYHSASKEGKEFAGIMQKKIAFCIGDGNHRVEKANSDYYILRKSVPTAVIVECGFLSNSQEAALLSDSSYQKKMAGAIARGVYEYIQKEAH